MTPARALITRGLALVLIGLSLGVAGAFGATRAMASILYGITPDDPVGKTVDAARAPDSLLGYAE